MNSKEKKIFDVVKENSGARTAEVARLSGMETSDSGGRHKNWEVHDILEEFERQGILKSEKGGTARSSPRYWHVAK